MPNFNEFPAVVEHTAVPPLNKNDAGTQPHNAFELIAQVAHTAVPPLVR